MWSPLNGAEPPASVRRTEAYKPTMISGEPFPNCLMLRTNRRQQRIAFEPTTAAQPWRREPLLMPRHPKKPYGRFGVLVRLGGVDCLIYRPRINGGKEIA